VLFTDVRFVLFVAACWLTFAAVAPSRRGGLLAVWGAAFYLAYASAAAPIVFGLILATYLIPTRYWLVPVVVTIGALAFFKLGAAESGLASMGGSNGASTTTHVLVPLGLSFLAFELVHFAVERKRGRITDVTFGGFLAFALYFPCRVAGPIKRYPEFIAAVRAAQPSVATVHDGLLRVLLGVFKKVAIADVLGLTVREIAYVGSPLHAIKIVLAYSLEIFFDFSAYSDIAIGVSQMFGIRVPENFRNPYLSANIQEFWTRWHISLSTWVRDYVFVPLGRAAFATSLRDRPLAIAVVSYLIAFVVVGAWHGLTANFILWGAYHGVLLSIHHVYRRTAGAWWATLPFAGTWLGRASATATTFALVSLGWVFFITADPGTALWLVRLIVGRG
jgi:alginate O-acetyltransferase complex protein AlgI